MERLTNNDIKIILFDLGRVLMHIDFDAFPNRLGLTTKELRSQYDQEIIQQTIRVYETGKISTNEFLESLYEIFQRKFSPKNILDAFNDIIVDDNQEIIPFVESARQQYRIAVLSNTCECHWEKVLRISSLIKIFPHTFTSFQFGAMKPEKIVYEKVCTTLNVQPSEVLFIDDLKENVDGAIAVGMKGIVFSNVNQVKFLIKKEN
jgi:HAD superfamily hydrolase (TIGR01509 family)